MLYHCVLKFLLELCVLRNIHSEGLVQPFMVKFFISALYSLSNFLDVCLSARVFRPYVLLRGIIFVVRFVSQLFNFLNNVIESYAVLGL